eukprot:TRINITY_DN991_c2_g2_i1.p1 TRINITY_DN991_c2_g2~~TRINITY_DN991_c2_g2_i1.p1  ORF type:complete len:1067 (-),score=324.58 TRINITY_DN991_c2_g2_i1:80-3280(-)
MAGILSEDSVFSDYTNASPLEEFVADLEETITELRQAQDAGRGVNSNGCVTRVVIHNDIKYILALYSLESGQTIEWTDRNRHLTSPMMSMLNDSLDFGSDSKHMFLKWFGLNEFFVLNPADTTSFLANVSKNEGSFLLGCLNAALVSCQCQLPAFVPLGDPGRRQYIGHSNPMIDFETDFCINAPRSLTHMSGLTSHFRSKIGISSQTPVIVSPRFKWGIVIPEGSDELSWRFGSKRGNKEDPALVQLLEGFERVPLWGSSQNPLRELFLSMDWKPFPEGKYVHNPVHCSLPPFESNWKFRFVVNPSSNPLKSSESPLGSLLNHCSRTIRRRFDDTKALQTVASELPENIVKTYQTKSRSASDVMSMDDSMMTNTSTTSMNDDNESMNSNNNNNNNNNNENSDGNGNSVNNADILDEDVGAPAMMVAGLVGQAIGSLSRSLVTEHSTEDLLVQVRMTLSELFEESPELVSSLTESAPEMISQTSHLQQSTSFSELLNAPKKPLHPFKTAPGISLTSLFCLRALEIGGVDEISLLWSFFCAELRSRWDNLIELPLTESMDEDGHQWSLLHQKLTMLQTCIRTTVELNERSAAQDESKKQKQEVQQTPSKAIEGTLLAINIDDNTAAMNSAGDAWKDDEDDDLFGDSDDEFEDCMSDDSEGDNMNSESENNKSEEEQEEVFVDRAPIGEGILRVTDLKLESGIGFIREPYTMVEPRWSEDRLHYRDQLLSGLGNSSEASDLRAQFYSAQLHSDMCAFKAANPECVLIDFVKWHSPKDLIKGELSVRISGVWLEMWSESEVLPISKQEPLWDPSAEAEQILLELESLSVAQLLVQAFAVTSDLTLQLLTFANTPATKLKSIQKSFKDAERVLEVSCRDIGESVTCAALGFDGCNKFDEISPKFKEVIQTISHLERQLSVGSALISLFGTNNDIVEDRDVMTYADELLQSVPRSKTRVRTPFISVPDSLKRRLAPVFESNTSDESEPHLFEDAPFSNKPMNMEFIYRAMTDRSLFSVQPSQSTKQQQNGSRRSRQQHQQQQNDDQHQDVPQRLFISVNGNDVRMAMGESY